MARIQKHQSSKPPAARMQPSQEKRTPEPSEVFEVGNDGVLVRADFYEPETRDDIYDISISWLQTPEDLIEFMDQFSRLAAEISDLHERFLDSVSEQLEEARRQPTEPRRIRALEARLAASSEDPDDEGRQWLTTVSKRYFKSVVVNHVAQWLQEPWDSGDEDLVKTGQDSALDYFLELGRDSCRVLGVTTIEGEMPFSTCYAAELRQPIEEANRAAEEHGLPVRFVEASAKTRKRYGWSKRQ